MTKKKIIVVEDEVIVAKDIAESLEKIGYEVVNTFSKGEKLLSFLEKENKIDLILMDNMLSGNITGIETAGKIKEKYNIPVVFLTAYADEKTIDKAKIVEPYGYIIKPFKEIDLRTSIEMALYKYKKEKEKLAGINQVKTINSAAIVRDFIYVKSNSKLVKVENNNLYFIEALKDYVIVHTKDEKYTIHSTMKDMVEKLDKKIFLRIHRSYILNINKIDSIEGNKIVLEDIDKKIPIGGSYRDSLFTELNFA